MILRVTVIVSEGDIRSLHDNPVPNISHVRFVAVSELHAGSGALR